MTPESNCDAEFKAAILEAAIADTDGTEAEVVEFLTALVGAFGAEVAIGLAMRSSRMVAD